MTLQSAQSLQVLARSPAQLPELVALLETSTSPSPSTSSPGHRKAHCLGQVRGLTALVLGTCLLELPSEVRTALADTRIC